MITRILKILPLKENQYQSRVTGKTELFKTLPMLITDGVDTMYVEALQERAQMILDANIKEGEVVTVELSFNARSYETKDHETKYSTDIVVQKLGRLF